MTSYPLPPNPCLVAILLLVKRASEPRIIFHYPPKPGEDDSQFRDMFKENPADDDSSSSSSDDESPDSSAKVSKPDEKKEIIGTGKSTPEVDEVDSASPEKIDGLKGVRAKLQWNDLFGYQSTILSKILQPAASSHKKRFEVGLNDLVFLGRPIFARPDGTWKKPKKLRRLSSKSNITAERVKDIQEQKKGTRVETLDYVNKDSGTSGLDTGMESQHESRGDEELLNMEECVEDDEPSEQMSDLKIDRNGKPDILPPNKAKQKPLAMFHVIFVLRPPALEYHLRVKEMYENVTKKLSQAMKWEQSRSGYVLKETAVITSLTKHMDTSHSKTRSDAALTSAHVFRRKAKFSNVVSRPDLAIESRESYSSPLQQYHCLSNRPHQFRADIISVSSDPISHFHPSTTKRPRAPAARPLADDSQLHADRRRCQRQRTPDRGILHPSVTIRCSINRGRYQRHGIRHGIRHHWTFKALSSGHHIQQIFPANIPVLRYSAFRHPKSRFPPHLLATSPSDPPTSPTRHLHRIAKRRHAEPGNRISDVRQTIPRPSTTPQNPQHALIHPTAILNSHPQ